MATKVELNYLKNNNEYEILQIAGLSNISETTVIIYFDSIFTGKNYTITSDSFSTISGIVPENNIVAFVPNMINIKVKISIDNYYIDFYINSLYYTKTFPSIILNENSWSLISYISGNNLAKNYWKNGDTKQIHLNQSFNYGSSPIKIDLDFNSFILGINHNAEIEGNNLIHFMIGKNLYNKLSCCVQLGMTYMNNEYTYGWNDCYMRTTYMQQFINAVPSDLFSVLKTVNKYSYNKVNNAFVFSTTKEKMCLLSTIEVFGNNMYGHDSSVGTKQYDFFKEKFGVFENASQEYAPLNFKKINNINTLNNTVLYLRSLANDSSGGFCGVTNKGGCSKGWSNGQRENVGPIFFV